MKNVKILLFLKYVLAGVACIGILDLPFWIISKIIFGEKIYFLESNVNLTFWYFLPNLFLGALTGASLFFLKNKLFSKRLIKTFLVSAFWFFIAPILFAILGLYLANMEALEAIGEMPVSFFHYFFFPFYAKGIILFFSFLTMPFLGIFEILKICGFILLFDFFLKRLKNL